MAIALLKPATLKGETTRRRLLTAAEHQFGEKGFHGTSITSITLRAGAAQGTFYLYFRSKEEIFLTLVQDIGHQLRVQSTAAIGKAGNRLEAERLGLEAFLQFANKHRGLYRIVQESQFVDAAVYREYYEKLAEGYAEALAQAARNGELAPGDATVRAWAMMGIAHFLGMRWCAWQKKLPPPEALDGIMDFVSHGMAPRPRKIL
ncbi:MAG: TetR/AcrR family transcriptional regulator [Hydrocarboniphaga effusa]|nr:TetR/AcrR family transcriptional regulator [Hydrocarboniphaga effusa]